MPSSPRSPDRAGFSLTELLVSLSIAGVTLATGVHFFAGHVRTSRGHFPRVEMQQGLRTALDAMTRDLRLAGGCLPTNGEFVALAGSDGPGADSITIRSGLVSGGMACVVAATTSPAAAGEQILSLEGTAGFAVEMLVYVRHPGGSGQISRIVGVGAMTVRLAEVTAMDYPTGSGVYALDERTYAVDVARSELPLLTLTVNRGSPQSFAAGIVDLQATYVLNQGCPACDRVALPATTDEWRLVSRIELSAAVKTIGQGASSSDPLLVARSSAKPRNLIP